MRLVSDGDDGVALAAIGRATTCPPAQCVPVLGARLVTGPLHVRSAALDALALTVDRVPHLALSSLLEVATRAEDPLLGRAHSVLTDVVRTKRLTRAHVDLLVEAMPRLLPNSDTVAAIRERAEYFSPTVRPSATTHGPLEEAVERQLDHEQAWLVLGDAWQAAGDVRGELVAHAHAGRDPVPLVREHASTLLGDAARYLGPELDAFLASVVWRHGLPRSAVARLSYDQLNDVSMPQLVAALVGAPIARFLTGLQVGLTSFEAEENDYEPVLAALRDTGRAHLLRDLVLGAFVYPDDTEISWAPWGNLSSLWSLTPQLERLHVRGAGGDFGDIDAPSLRSLTVETGGLGRHEFNQLAASHAPVLEELELWLGDENYGAECDTDDVVRLLKRGHSSLRRLALKNTFLASSLIEPLAKAPLTVGLRALDLSMSTLGDEHVDLVVRHAPAFAHLDRFDLSENHFSPAAEREIRSVLPNAVFDDQRRAGPGERYVAVGE